MNNDVHAYSKAQQLGETTLDAEQRYVEEQRKDYGRGPYGQEDFICNTCDSWPCVDDCPAQTTPDTLQRKCDRAQLSPLAWLQRDQERSRAPFHERYPAHPAADEARAVLADAAGLSPAPAITED